VQGLRSLDDGSVPPIIDLSVLDRKIFVTNRDAITFTRKLLDEERLFAGVSSGAIARVAVRIAGELDEGTSCSSSPTTAGSTCPQASTRVRRTRSRTWTPPSGGDPTARTPVLTGATGPR
jgi:cysteine synthase